MTAPSRRELLLGLSAAALAGCGTAKAAPVSAPAPSGAMPEIAPPGVIHDGFPVGRLGIDPAVRYPDVRSFRRKLGLIIPATNTSMEHELWSLLLQNREELAGVGLHTTPIVTPRPQLKTEADLAEYRRQFVGGLSTAVDHALLAQPDALIMGMSLEHILRGIGPIRELVKDVEARSGLGWATWHDAAAAALKKLNARRIGLLTPFDRVGNENATQMFRDLGFEVVTSLGFACANALHIAHVPDAAKEKAITELLATPANRLDAVVQCGTNMSLLGVTERLEPVVKVPILGINAVTFWHALRTNGLDRPLQGGGMLLRAT